MQKRTEWVQTCQGSLSLLIVILALSWMSGLSVDSCTTERRCNGSHFTSPRCLSPFNGDHTVWNQRPAARNPAGTNLNKRSPLTATELYFRAAAAWHDLRFTLAFKN